MPAGHQPVTGKGSLAQAAAKDVQFDLTQKGIDFLGYKSLRNILGTLGRSSAGSHDTPYLATGIEADAWSKQYEFGDVLNIDVNETLTNALGLPSVIMMICRMSFFCASKRRRASLRPSAVFV